MKTLYLVQQAHPELNGVRTNCGIFDSIEKAEAACGDVYTYYSSFSLNEHIDYLCKGVKYTWPYKKEGDDAI